jgi:hypothetical protein
MHEKPLDQNQDQKSPQAQHGISIHVRCPRCGEDGWLIERTIVKKPISNLKTENTWEDGKVVDSKEIQVTNRSHPYKYLSFLELFVGRGFQRTHPIINPTVQMLRPGDSGYEEHMAAVQSVEDFGITIAALTQVTPLVVKKHPSMTSQVQKWISCLSVVERALDSTVDNRYGRSLFEWVYICQTAIKEGIGIAAKKYSGFTEDDKEIRLSHKHIKDMIPIAAHFAVSFPYALTYFLDSGMLISDVISDDAELFKATEMQRLGEKNLD